MSLSCDHLIWDLGNVGASTWIVTAFSLVLLESWFVSLADWKRVRVVEHICLRKSCFSIVHVVDGHIRLWKPLSLNVNTLLGIILKNHILTHQVSDASNLLILESTWVGASHSHGTGLKESRGGRGWLWLSEVVSVLSLEVTFFMLAVMVWKQRTESLTWSCNVSIIEVLVLVHVGFVDHTNHWLWFIDVNLWVLVLLLVGCVLDIVTIIADKLLGLLLWLTVVASQWSRDTSRVKSADVGLMLSELFTIKKDVKKRLLTVLSSGKT